MCVCVCLRILYYQIHHNTKPSPLLQAPVILKLLQFPEKALMASVGSYTSNALCLDILSFTGHSPGQLAFVLQDLSQLPLALILKAE